MTNHAGERRRIWTLVIVLAVLFLSWFAVDAGRLLVVDNPKPSDVILVLAGETDRRPARALELLDQGYGKKVLIDVPAGARIYDLSQVQLAQNYAARLPRAAAVGICPISGLSTYDESHDARKCLEREEGSRVLIVTSEFHTRRALSIFRHEVPGKSFSVAVAHNPTQFGQRWWSHREWAKNCVDEWLKLLWWNSIDRWR